MNLDFKKKVIYLRCWSSLKAKVMACKAPSSAVPSSTIASNMGEASSSRFKRMRAKALRVLAHVKSDCFFSTLLASSKADLLFPLSRKSEKAGLVNAQRNFTNENNFKKWKQRLTVNWSQASLSDRILHLGVALATFCTFSFWSHGYHAIFMPLFKEEDKRRNVLALGSQLFS